LEQTKKPSNFENLAGFCKSLHSYHVICLRDIVSYLTCEHLIKENQEITEKDWKVRFPDYVPKQKNNDDCGVFMLQIIRSLSSGTQISFNYDIQFIRNKMILELIYNKLFEPTKAKVLFGDTNYEECYVEDFLLYAPVFR